MKWVPIIDNFDNNTENHIVEENKGLNLNILHTYIVEWLLIIIV